MSKTNKNLIYIKLGGSLITNKDTESTSRVRVIKNLASEIADFKSEHKSTNIIIGHGAGSYGHIQALRNNLHICRHTASRWNGALEVAKSVSKLSRIVLHELQQAGVQSKQINPSESAICNNGKLMSLDTTQIKQALHRNIIPLTHGDVCFDDVCGASIISTEAIFAYLATKLPPSDIYIAGNAKGVLDSYPNGNTIPKISNSSKRRLLNLISTSTSPDITGGMKSKVHTMLQLIKQQPGLTVHIFSAKTPGALRKALAGSTSNTTILSDNHTRSLSQSSL
tara:strand:- start:8086 stop:8928 length:843 start_codon:yes stop_codon:yes gene_type:complete